MSYFQSGFKTERKDTGRNHTFFGKYRAIVTNNNDKKDKMGRIKVKCPAVLGNDESQWCNPCVPFAGQNKGMLFLPKVGDSVWVEFEGGDPNKPIWVGNWFGLYETPRRDDVYRNLGTMHVIETEQTRIVFDDKTKEIFIKGNAKVTIDSPTTINGTVTVNGNLNVKKGQYGGGSIHSDASIDTDGFLQVDGNITAKGSINGSNI
jgi:phage baseplate assembly protein gpV